MKTLFKVAIAATVIGFAVSPAHAQGWRDQVKEIRFGILSGENEKDRIARYEPFKAYLEKELGVPVRIFTASAYDGVIQAIAGDQVEFAFFGSSSYAAAYTETNGGVEPMLSRLQNDGSTGYYSVITVRCDSGIASIDQLKGKVMAFADPDSTSGYAVPYFNLKDQGYDPETYFSNIPFSGAHETGVLGVVNKQFDAAATWITNEKSGVPQRMAAKGMIEEGEICIIWKSPEITSGPFTARANLPEDLKQEMKAAVLDIVDKDPAAFKMMTGGDKSTQKGWIEVDHERYRWIVEMREEIRQLRRQRGS